MAGGDTYRSLFVFLICFWTLATFFSYSFKDDLQGQQLTTMGPDCFEYGSACASTSDNVFKTALNYVFTFLDNVPVVNLFTPLARILTMQYASVPKLFSIFLDSIGVITGLVVYGLIRQG